MALAVFALFLAVPLIEIALFIVVGGEIGLWPTLAIVIVTAILGATLIRLQGTAVARDARSRLQRGEAPIAAMFHGIFLIVAGAFLMTPGFFTDAVGFLLLLPPVRALAVRLALRYADVKLTAYATGQGPDLGMDPGPNPGPGQGPGRSRGRRAAEDDVIDGTYRDVTPETNAPDSPHGPDTRIGPR